MNKKNKKMGDTAGITYKQETADILMNISSFFYYIHCENSDLLFFAKYCNSLN